MDESAGKMLVFHCHLEYDKRQQYTRREMIELIEPHRQLLCFFAQVSGYRRCVLGLDFEGYDPSDSSVPVLVMDGEEARVLLGVHGRRFKRAYRVSEPGNSLVVTFSSASVTGWFQMGWKLDPERVVSEVFEAGMGQPYNPVIGYLLVDETYSVIGPPGRSIDPAFYSKREALRAAEAYGRQDDVHEVVELYLEGVMNVVFEDVGDILVDGRTAKRLVAACQQRGLAVNEEAWRKIDASIRETAYSCRGLLTV